MGDMDRWIFTVCEVRLLHGDLRRQHGMRDQDGPIELVRCVPARPRAYARARRVLVACVLRYQSFLALDDEVYCVCAICLKEEVRPLSLMVWARATVENHAHIAPNGCINS